MKVNNAKSVNTAQAHFMKAPVGEIEYSRFKGMPSHTYDCNGGDIIPIGLYEILPHDTLNLSVQDFVIRQATLAVPVMDDLFVDVYAVWIPNRVVNDSFVNVMGENSSGSWTAPEVDLAPLMNSSSGTIQIPVGSIADYYGLPTQQPFPKALAAQMNDLPFRGYIFAFNELFRSQDYIPPIPCTKLNIFTGMLAPVAQQGDSFNITVAAGTVSDGSARGGAIQKAIGGTGSSAANSYTVPGTLCGYSMLNKPLKACKLHDYFTSVLPEPQKNEEITVGIFGGESFRFLDSYVTAQNFESNNGLILSTGQAASYVRELVISNANGEGAVSVGSSTGSAAAGGDIKGTNLGIDLSNLGLTINDLRNSVVAQQCAELLARSGSRYKEFISAAFGLEIEDQYADKPVLLGHFRRKLDVYQTAQTSASSSESAQGSLAAYGYTVTGGDLFQKTFVEHGYVHIFAVIRQANIYSSMVERHFMRRSRLDFYQPLLANISEQPVFTYQINPFVNSLEQVWGYQEAFAEYRFFPNRVSGTMRKGLDDVETLANWTYADPFNSALTIATGDWLKSNAAEVIRPTLAADETNISQFKCKVTFNLDFQRPMPVYSVPGLDIF